MGKPTIKVSDHLYVNLVCLRSGGYDNWTFVWLPDYLASTDKKRAMEMAKEFLFEIRLDASHLWTEDDIKTIRADRLRFPSR